ncbi:Hypothetical protein LUCI_4706 [Lucifera butyrica]|uniref:Type II secretion system protein GspC N-terminal domain-containing protein n=1 Tax=Lucifera butyrica TaxID=1351585 RepID=A0A498R9N7_9FIRM|nr:hypothetical protein [Lucifera butyrica]VBB09416.1 Hypothetical protein LUCI_4706 [Lucifera butyrica]
MNRRLGWMIAGGLLLIGAVYFYPASEAPPAGPAGSVPSPVAKAGQPLSGRPVMPQGYQAAAEPLRDPFAVPPEYAVKEEPPAVAAPAGTMPDLPEKPGNEKLPVLKLTGIAAAGENRAAIIEAGKVTRSYMPGDSVGAYQVTAIGQDSVTLQGPQGEMVLEIGR